MSAFIVPAGHIDYLISAAVAVNFPHGSMRWQGERVALDTADAVGAALWRENVASVAYRYADSAREGLPGPVPTADPDAYTFRSYRIVAPMSVLKAIDGYEYQSCEHPEWEASEARAFCDRLRGAMIRCLPGYTAAAWEIDARGDGNGLPPQIVPDASRW